MNMENIQPKISVIMPVYNSKEYILEAIESVLNQSFTDFELLLIDDGSSDGSEKICDKLAQEDSRIKVFHKKNGGISSARNYGLEHSNGKYIAFIDNDDRYKKDFLKTAFEEFDNSKLDFLKCGAERHVLKNDKLVQRELRQIPYNISLNKELFLSTYFKFKETCIYNTIWNGLYRKDFLVKYNIKFNEAIRLGHDDQLFNIDLFRHFSSFKILSECYYIWMQRSEHSTSLQYNEEYFNESIYTLNYEKMMFGELNPNYLLKPEWQCRIAEYFFKGLSNIFSSRKVDPIPLKVQYESFCKWIRQYKANNLLNKQMVITILPIKKKRGILLLLAVETNPLIAFTCSKMYFQIKRL